MPGREATLLPQHRLGEPLPRRVAVLRALQLGDLLVSVPAFRALRAALPEAEIVLVGLPWAAAFVRRFAHYLDGFREFPGYPGLPERPPDLEQLPRFLESVQRERFDLAIQLHGSGTITNPLTVLLGARRNAGFFVPGQFCPDAERFLAYPAQVPERWRVLRLLDFLGVPLRGEELEFPLWPEDRQALQAVEAARGLRPGSYVCVHPGARAAARRWPPELFAAVADGLAARGLRVVLTGSPDDAPLTRATAAAMRAGALDLAGQTSLGALAALLHGTRLLVCNHTGVLHLASALRVPSVIVYHRQSEYEGWPPSDRQRHRVACGVLGVTPAAVLAQADDLLRQEGADVAVGAASRAALVRLGSPDLPHDGPQPARPASPETPAQEQPPSCAPCVS